MPLSSLTGTVVKRVRKAAKKAVKKGIKKAMSAATKAKLRKAAKSRCAKVKKAGGNARKAIQA